MIEALVFVAIIVAGLFIIIRFTSKTAHSAHRRVDEHRQVQSRLKAEYGVTVTDDHVDDALFESEDGATALAEMADGTLQLVHLRGQASRAYAQPEGNGIWRELPRLAEREKV